MKTAEANNAPQVGHYKFTPKKKAKALWMTIKSPSFQAQQKQLRPENTAAGGVKARSQPEHIRMEIYNAIREIYLRANLFCECHADIAGVTNQTYRVQSNQIHHKRGRDGLLLFDVR